MPAQPSWHDGRSSDEEGARRLGRGDARVDGGAGGGRPLPLARRPGDATFDDIVGARINTYRRDDGTKMLRVYVDLEPHETPNPYDDPDDCLDTVVVFFDTRGDEHPDFRLSQSSDCASGGGGGYLIRIGHGPLDVRFVRPWGCGGDGFCPIFPVRFEFHHLRATKHVRWFVRSGSLAATLATDRAPDHGWYEH